MKAKIICALYVIGDLANCVALLTLSALYNPLSFYNSNVEKHVIMLLKFVSALIFKKQILAKSIFRLIKKQNHKNLVLKLKIILDFLQFEKALHVWKGIQKAAI